MADHRLTRCQLAIMQVVWNQGSVTVGDVVEAITRKLAYTTVLTRIKVLETKGFIARGEMRGRALTYYPLISREKAWHDTAKECAESFFEGSGEKMTANLLKMTQLGSDDLEDFFYGVSSIPERSAYVFTSEAARTG